MTLEEKISAGQIIDIVGMSKRPEYYSGRGATLSDLNGRMLQKFYDGIGNCLGKDAAQNFVLMVADIPVLSATDFLLNLYRLESNNWKWDKSKLGNEKGIYAGDIGSAFGTIASVMSGSLKRDETEMIRGQFLRDYGLNIKSKQSNKDPGAYL